MFSSWSSLPSRSRGSASATNTSTSRRRRPQLGTRYIPITLIILLVVSCSSSCGAGGVTAVTLTDPSNVFLRRAPKAGKKNYYNSKSASPKKKSPPKKKSKSSKKTSLPTRRPTSDRKFYGRSIRFQFLVSYSIICSHRFLFSFLCYWEI